MKGIENRMKEEAESPCTLRVVRFEVWGRERRGEERWDVRKLDGRERHFCQTLGEIIMSIFGVPRPCK